MAVVAEMLAMWKDWHQLTGYIRAPCKDWSEHFCSVAEQVLLEPVLSFLLKKNPNTKATVDSFE